MGSVDSIAPGPWPILFVMINLIAVIETPLLALQPPSELSLLKLILLVLLAGGLVLFALAFVLTLMRVARRRVARQKASLEGTHTTASTDVWGASASRVELDPDAPREANPDQDLPPMGGRFR